ncbi:ribbon-helix-helix protein [Nitrosospira sp. Nsp5]|uniref:Ribbon-helix-helix domain-containing protein n=1 Tax=Nitrosospira multiformis TaxID=1231 RepID=A0ABY0TLA7_9PROT|nr:MULTISPECIES: ribbon-helix-helix domain-containing protein [Nitrosospira]PTR09937.1 ribbon-helix-helix protein [Nitrosospira sp. Nsp5]SDR00946.1 Ribbon-helix-helix domain-containing protein [Nitrosospira multiformis]
MTELRMRTLELANGHRTGIRLDPATWQAVEWIAGQQKRKWPEWVREQLEKHPNADNRTAVIRAAAMDTMLLETTLAERSTTLDSIAEGHPLLRYSAMMNDEEFAESMRAGIIDGSEEMGGFTLHAGKDEFGQYCLWFENHLKGWPNLVIPMPEEEKK